MARAFIGEMECEVHADRDLGESWAVTVVPPPPRKGRPVRTPLVMKLQGNDRAAVIKGALEVLQKRGDIQRFELDPAPEPPAEPPAPPPAKGA